MRIHGTVNQGLQNKRRAFQSIHQDKDLNFILRKKLWFKQRIILRIVIDKATRVFVTIHGDSFFLNLKVGDFMDPN